MLNRVASCANARALYLGHGDQKRVSCTETALVITNAQKQIYRYPIDRVARIVCSTSANWSGAALALCMHHAINIVWLDISGNQALGCLYPQQAQQHSFEICLDMLFETTEGLCTYEHWRRSRRMKILNHWATNNAAKVTPSNFENLKRSLVYRGEASQTLPNALRPYTLAWIAAQFTSNDLRPLFWDSQGGQIRLDEHLHELLWATLSLDCGSFVEMVDAEKELVYLFESWIAINSSRFMKHVTSLRIMAQKALYNI